MDPIRPGLEGGGGGSYEGPGGRAAALEVSVVPVPVLVIPVGKVSVPLAVGDPAEGRVVVEAGVEDLVHDLLRLLGADVPHRQDGAQGAASDARLSREEDAVREEEPQTCGGGGGGRVPGDAPSNQS